MGEIIQGVGPLSQGVSLFFACHFQYSARVDRVDRGGGAPLSLVLPVIFNT